MKRFIVAVVGLLLAGQVLAAEVSCEKFGEMAYNAAAARDRGAPQDEVARTLAKNYGDDRAEGLAKVVFMHSELDPDTLLFASRIQCVQSADDAKTAAPADTGPVPSTDRADQVTSAVPVVASGYGHAFDVCMSKSNGVTADMLDCIGDETSKQDVQLNRNYAAAMMVRKPDQRDELKTGERAWIKARDSKCALDAEGGTAAQINSASCVLDMTAQRAKEILALRPDAKP